MKLAALFVLPLLIAAPGPSLAVDTAAPITVSMANFHFSPASIRMVHGQRYVLHLVNQAHGGHDFNAPQFFAAATLDDASRALVRGGAVEVAGGATADVTLTAPTAGRYAVHCSHFLHSSFGMKGEIVVE